MYDVYKIREQFPMLKQTMQGKPLVFLDNASTTFKPQCVIDAINDYYSKYTSNSKRGDYDLSNHVDNVIEEARRNVSKFINCDVNEVVFTSGDTLAINHVAYGWGLKFLKPGDEILLTEAEHASNVLPWYHVAKLTGAEIKFIPLNNDNEITVENFKKVISKKVKLVAVAHIGNVLGYVNPIKEMIDIAHQYGALFLVDGAQSVPHMKTDFKEYDMDFLTFSAHKMCGPTGLGVLVGKYNLLEEMDCFLTGGGMNVTFDNKLNVEAYKPPLKFEAGTLPLGEIFGFNAALKFLMDLGIDNIYQHEQEIFSYLKEKIKDCDNLIIYNPKCDRSILSFNIKGVFPQDEGTLFNYHGVAVRSGMHCAKMLPDHLNCVGSVRMSTYLYTTKEDIDAFVDVIKNGGNILDAYFN